MRYNGRPARRAGGRPAPPPAVEADLCLLVCGKAVISPRDVLSFVPWRSRRLSFLDQQSAVIDSWVEYLFAGTQRHWQATKSNSQAGCNFRRTNARPGIGTARLFGSG